MELVEYAPRRWVTILNKLLFTSTGSYAFGRAVFEPTGNFFRSYFNDICPGNGWKFGVEDDLENLSRLEILGNGVSGLSKSLLEAKLKSYLL